MSEDRALAALAHSRDPSVRYLTLTEVLAKRSSDPQVLAARRAIPRGVRVRRLLAGQAEDGGFGINPYAKWGGGFWRLVALAELALPPGDGRVRRLAEHVLDWLEGGRGAMRPLEIAGRVRAHATQDGYTLAALSLLGLARAARVRRLAHRLIEWQWPDGGWNCDHRPGATHSSFHETHGALWGLAEYHLATGDAGALQAAERAADFLLRHDLFRAEESGRVISGAWLQLRFPPYWHYDVLQGLWVLSRAGKMGDPRSGDALRQVLQKRRPDGMWRADGYHWKPPGAVGSNVEVVDWGRRGPSEWVTLRVFRVLRAAGGYML